MTHCPIETFAALDAHPFLQAAFIQRCPEIDVKTDRETALARLHSVHERTREECGFAGMPLVTSEQVHGNTIAVVTSSLPRGAFPSTDGMVTAQHQVCLAIYVADCAAVFIADQTGKAIGLVHSGKKGTELGIVPAAIKKMIQEFGCDATDLIVQISPCIRPPHYEVDIAATIAQQAREAGVSQVSDCGFCTASNPDRYYSYRREKGETGRLLALMALV